MRADLPWAAGEENDLRSLMVRVNRRDVPRIGSGAQGLHYEIHGIGCRLWREGGPEVDFDIDDDGVEIFNAWRVVAFADSLGEQGVPTDDEVERGLAELSRRGEIRSIGPGWYARRYELT